MIIMDQKKLRNYYSGKSLRMLFNFMICCLIAGCLLLGPAAGEASGANAKYIILMIADGWGAKHIEAANNYRSATSDPIPLYQTDPAWTKYFMSTHPYGGIYDPVQAASDFNYMLSGAITDSAAAATVLYSGVKTQNARISVSYDAVDRLIVLGEEARGMGKLSGAVSSVPVSHATPGAWMAHNDDRMNVYAIADEGLFGDPNTTGLSTETGYAGGHGPTEPTIDLVIGDGRSGYINSQIRDKLFAESGSPDKHYLVERETGTDGADALLTAAQNPGVTKMAGLFDHFYRNADGLGGTSAERLENPTLSDSTAAALTLLNKDPDGFVLMVEGGAVDWAGHSNNMDQMIGEMKDFDDSIQTAIDWIEDSGNGSSWDNTLLIVTGDHECGYLTKDRGVLLSEPLGEVSPSTLLQEKIVNGTEGRRASWNDINGNSYIDDGETVYWAWNSGNHSNSIIPLYARGTGTELFSNYIAGYDQLFLSNYIDNSDVFTVMYDIMTSCTETGTITIVPGQTLTGNPVDLTSIVNKSNAVNLLYTVRDEGGGCEVDPAGTYIDAENYTGTIPTSTGTGTFSTESTTGGYLGSGYLKSNGGGLGDCTSAMNEGKEYQVNFPAAGTYTVWIKGYAVSRSTDSIFIGLDGNCAGALRETAPSCSGAECDLYLNKWIWTSRIQNGTNTITVPSAGIHRVNIWARENGHLTDGIYITQGTETPDDVSHGVEVDPTNCSASIFSGDEAAAQSLDTSGWTDAVKELEVLGDDALCLTPLGPVTETFIFESTSTGSDSIIVSNNTAIKSSDPSDGDLDIIMQRFQVDSDNGDDGQVELVSLGLIDHGSSTGILDAKVYISSISSSALPTGAVLVGDSGPWDGSSITLPFDHGTVSDYTVINGMSKYIYIVYDLATGEEGNTIQSNVTGLSAALPDIGAGNVGASNLLTIQACTETGTITIVPGQTLTGNPVDLTSIVNKSNAVNLLYTVRDEGGGCEVDPAGTYIDAENYTGTIPTATGTGTFSTESTTGGYLGSGYLKSNGGGLGDCTSAMNEGKEYQIDFPTAGTYTVWIKGYAASKSTDSIFVGLDGNCAGALRETDPSCSGAGCDPYLNKWIWTNSIQNGTNTITVPSSGIHRVNIWARENGHLTDGIYITQGTETPDDVSHGVEVDPTNCSASIFSGDEAAAQNVDTSGWTDAVKELEVMGNDALCLTPLGPVTETFVFDSTSDSGQPVSSINDPLDGSKLNNQAADPYLINGIASDNIAVSGVDISVSGGAWISAVCSGCPGTSVSWEYEWTLPADDSYTIRSRARDSSGNVELPSSGNAITIDRTNPNVIDSVPPNGTSGIAINSSVTITWDEDVDCATVDTSTVVSDSPAWSLSDCTGNQAVFSTGGQAYLTDYTVTASTAVTDLSGNPMLADYVISYSTAALASVDWSSCRTEAGRTAIPVGGTSTQVILSSPVSDITKAFLLMDSSGDSALQKGMHHMVSGNLLDLNTIEFKRVGNAGQAEISYSLIECFNNEFAVQRGEVVIGNGLTTNTAGIASVDISRSIVIVNSRADITGNDQFNAHATGELLDAVTVHVKRAPQAVNAETTVVFQVIEFPAESGVKVQSGEVEFSGGQSISDALAEAVNLNSSWLYFSYDAGNDGLLQTTIGGQLTASAQVMFARHRSINYSNRIRYYVVEFPAGEVIVQRGSSSFTGGGAAIQSHNIAIAPVADVNKSWTYVTNTTHGTGSAFPRNRWTELLSNNANIQMSNWRANSSNANALFEWQVVEFVAGVQ